MPYLSVDGTFAPYHQGGRSRILHSRQGQMQGIAEDLLVKVGLKDPLNVYAPGLTMQEVWDNYGEKIDRYENDNKGLHSQGMQKEIQKDIDAVYRMRNGIQRAFETGGVIGAVERKKLGAVVEATEAVYKKLNAAKKQFGWTHFQEPAPEAAPGMPPVPAKEEFPWGLALLGLGAAIALSRR